MTLVKTKEQVSGFTVQEISFYTHEIYLDGQLIATIDYDSEDLVTQPWLVIVNGVESFRATTYMQCYRYISLRNKLAIAA